MDTLRTGALIAATLTMGLMAGLFQAYSYSVMPGLRDASDRTFVDAMQRINVAILNGWFMLLLFGAIGFTVLAGALHLSGSWRPVLWWIVAALVLYLATIAITGAVNVPLNNEIVAAGAPDQIADLAAVRERFEDRWVRWNLARSVTSTAAFAALAWASILHGRVR